MAVNARKENQPKSRSTYYVFYYGKIRLSLNWGRDCLVAFERTRQRASTLHGEAFSHNMRFNFDRRQGLKLTRHGLTTHRSDCGNFSIFKRDKASRGFPDDAMSLAVAEHHNGVC